MLIKIPTFRWALLPDSDDSVTPRIRHRYWTRTLKWERGRAPLAPARKPWLAPSEKVQAFNFYIHLEVLSGCDVAADTAVRQYIRQQGRLPRIFHPLRFHVGTDTGHTYWPKSEASHLVQLARIVRGPLAREMVMDDVKSWEFLIVTHVCRTDLDTDPKPTQRWHSVASKILEGRPPERATRTSKSSSSAKAANQRAPARVAIKSCCAGADADVANNQPRPDDEGPDHLVEIPL